MASSMTTAQRVTVIVVTYNGASYVGGCLRSLLAEDEGTLDVVVVDNASRDGTPDLVCGEFPQVRLFSEPTNIGYGGAINRGALLSRREYLAIVNQDLVVTPGWLEPLVAALDQHPSAGLVTPKILLAGDPLRINTCGNAVHYTGITPCRGYLAPAEAYAQLEEVAAVSGAALVIRREVFELLRGFDPNFFLYLEDTDLSLRAALAGYESLFVPDSLVLHDFKPQFSPEKIGYLERNRLAMLLKLYRWRTLLALMPALLLTEFLVLGYAALLGPRSFVAKLRAYVWTATHIRDIFAERGHVQELRRVQDAALLARCTAALQLDELDHPLGRLVMALFNPLLRAWYNLLRRVVV